MNFLITYSLFNSLQFGLSLCSAETVGLALCPNQESPSGPGPGTWGWLGHGTLGLLAYSWSFPPFTSHCSSYSPSGVQQLSPGTQTLEHSPSIFSALSMGHIV